MKSTRVRSPLAIQVASSLPSEHYNTRALVLLTLNAATSTIILLFVSTVCTERQEVWAIHKRLYVSASGTSRPRIRARRVGRELFREAWWTTRECCSFRLPFLARRWWLKPRSSLLPIASSRSFEFQSPGNRRCACTDLTC